MESASVDNVRRKIAHNLRSAIGVMVPILDRFDTLDSDTQTEAIRVLREQCAWLVELADRVRAGTE